MFAVFLLPVAALFLRPVLRSFWAMFSYQLCFLANLGDTTPYAKLTASEALAPICACLSSQIARRIQRLMLQAAPTR